ncbi:MAG: hypothetical protein V1848_02725 [Candidatus Magasanikbacteria bacterium]
MLRKIYNFILILICFALILPPFRVDAIGDASMTGGGFEIYADNFTTFDSYQITGGDFTLESTGSASGPITVGDAPITGTIILNDTLGNLGVINKYLYMDNGLATTTFVFVFFGAGYSGYCKDGFTYTAQPCTGQIAIDMGGPTQNDIPLGLGVITTAINASTANHNLTATNDGVNTVNITNSQPNGVARIITDTIADTDFVTTGFIDGTSTYVLKGGFQAQENGIMDFSESTNSVNLGALSPSAVASGDVVLSVTTDSSTGYTIAINEDGELRSGANFIDNVIDGSVTAGSEEYGYAVTGTDRDATLAAGDNGIGGAPTDIATYGGITTDRETTVSFKASRTATTPEGNYSHSVYFTLTVNP